MLKNEECNKPNTACDNILYHRTLHNKLEKWVSKINKMQNKRFAFENLPHESNDVLRMHCILYHILSYIEITTFFFKTFIKNYYFTCIRNKFNNSNCYFFMSFRTLFVYICLIVYKTFLTFIPNLGI